MHVLVYLRTKKCFQMIQLMCLQNSFKYSSPALSPFLVPRLLGLSFLTLNKGGRSPRSLPLILLRHSLIKIVRFINAWMPYSPWKLLNYKGKLSFTSKQLIQTDGVQTK
jgi:hypothetical protein